MQKYRCDKMTDRQKARYKEVNRKTAAANHLKKKLNEDAKKKKLGIGNRNVGFSNKFQNLLQVLREWFKLLLKLQKSLQKKC